MANMKVWVVLVLDGKQKSATKIVLDHDADVDDLREGVVNKFPNEHLQAADMTVYQDKEAFDSKHEPLSEDADVSKNNKTSSYFVVATSPTSLEGKSSGSNNTKYVVPPSCMLTYVDDAKDTVDPSTWTSEPRFVTVDVGVADMRTNRDRVYLNGHVLVGSREAALVAELKDFKHNWCSLFIGGCYGVGKSTALKVLAVFIQKRCLNATVWYLRNNVDQQVQTAFRDFEATRKAPLYLIIDQIDEQSARIMSEYAHVDGRYLVMASSANAGLFGDTPLSASTQNDSVKQHAFPSLPKNEFRVWLEHEKQEEGAEQVAVCGDWLLKADVFGLLPLVTSKPGSVCIADADALFDFCGGHFYTLANMLGRSAEQHRIPMQKWFDDLVQRAIKFLELNPSTAAYIVENMGLVLNRTISFISATLKLDHRFFDHKGSPHSPMHAIVAVKAAQTCLVNPQSHAMIKAIVELPKGAQGCIIERLLCRRENLRLMMHTVLGANEEADDVVTMFGSYDELAEQLRQVVMGRSIENLQLRVSFVPYQSNFKNVDVVHVAVENKRIRVVGNQITVQTAMEHKKSMQWYNELGQLKTCVQMALDDHKLDVEFTLCFTCKTANLKDASKDTLRRDNMTTVIVPISALVPKTVCDAMQMGVSGTPEQLLVTRV